MTICMIKDKLINIKDPSISLEMVKHFYKRTNKHIELVKKFGNLLIDTLFAEYTPMRDTLEIHDMSKFTCKEEFEPYIKLTWNYKLKKEGKKGSINTDEMNKASFHHVTTNPHHPEYHSPNPSLNTKDRDKPSELVEATAMPKECLLEMVADWAAMAEEHNEGSPRKWADDNINKRWKFDENQVRYIYELIGIVEDYNNKEK